MNRHHWANASLIEPYRHLARTAREAVGVYASNIHGIGLFCKREISAGEMVRILTCAQGYIFADLKIGWAQKKDSLASNPPPPRALWPSDFFF